MRVFEEVKLSLKLKNQGKYEVAYKWVWTTSCYSGELMESVFHWIIIWIHSSLVARFNLEQTNPVQPDLNSMFNVSPPYGSLISNKPTTVTICFKPDREVVIKEQPLLPCEVWMTHWFCFGPKWKLLRVDTTVTELIFYRWLNPALGPEEKLSPSWLSRFQLNRFSPGEGWFILSSLIYYLLIVQNHYCINTVQNWSDCV